MEFYLLWKLISSLLGTFSETTINDPSKPMFRG